MNNNNIRAAKRRSYWAINKMTQEDFKELQKIINKDIKKELLLKKEFRKKSKYE